MAWTAACWCPLAHWRRTSGAARSAALAGALDGVVAFSDRGGVSFTLRLIYADALANYRPGQFNSILVITKGPHSDQTLDGPGLQEFIKASLDPNRPVAVNVIDIGDDPDRATWEAVAQLTGGSYQAVSNADSPRPRRRSPAWCPRVATRRFSSRRPRWLRPLLLPG